MLHEWAKAWGVPYPALLDLQRRMGVVDTDPAPVAPGRSEGAISNAIRIEASQKGMRLWRNNVGVLTDDTGRPVRFGLANDSPALNKKIKSHDLIGIDNSPIALADVGQPRGRFLSVECKEEGWHFTGTPREEAQQRWAEVVISLGGRALFANREGLL